MVIFFTSEATVEKYDHILSMLWTKKLDNVSEDLQPVSGKSGFASGGCFPLRLRDPLMKEQMPFCPTGVRGWGSFPGFCNKVDRERHGGGVQIA